MTNYVTNEGRSLTNNSLQAPSINSYGAHIVIDFWTQLALDGHVFQLRAGTVTTPLVGDAPLTDTNAEFCVDGLTSTDVILVGELGIAVRLGTGTLHEYALKSRQGSNSSSGTAFTLLPLLVSAKQGAAAAPVSVKTARVAAHATTVPAETATTTLRHFEWSQPIAMGAYAGDIQWSPRTPAVLLGQHCLWGQIAATTTGPSYYAHLNIVDLQRSQLGI